MLSSFVERKTRLEPTLRVRHSREIYLHPQPLEGVFGVASCKNIYFQRKKDSQMLSSFVERKTRLELATPTLARLCSTN